MAAAKEVLFLYFCNFLFRLQILETVNIQHHCDLETEDSCPHTTRSKAGHTC